MSDATCESRVMPRTALGLIALVLMDVRRDLIPRTEFGVRSAHGG